eukprot:scaffold5382_cov114-Isochrysis_galbana.AAC.9
MMSSSFDPFLPTAAELAGDALASCLHNVKLGVWERWKASHFMCVRVLIRFRSASIGFSFNLLRGCVRTRLQPPSSSAHSCITTHLGVALLMGNRCEWFISHPISLNQSEPVLVLRSSQRELSNAHEITFPDAREAKALWTPPLGAVCRLRTAAGATRAQTSAT